MFLLFPKAVLSVDDERHCLLVTPEPVVTDRMLEPYLCAGGHRDIYSKDEENI